MLLKRWEPLADLRRMDAEMDRMWRHMVRPSFVWRRLRVEDGHVAMDMFPGRGQSGGACGGARTPAPSSCTGFSPIGARAPRVGGGVGAPRRPATSPGYTGSSPPSYGIRLGEISSPR